MKLDPIPLFGIGNVGKSVNVNAQERTNLYAEVDPETGTLKLYGTPGLTVEVSFGANPVRGAYPHGDVWYAVAGSTLYEINNVGTLTNRGSLVTTEGRVDMVDNGLQLLIVDGTEGYIYTFATTTLAEIADADFPPCETCAFLNGRFVVQKTGSAQFFISDIYDGTAWDALDFASAESSPDDLVRVYADNGVLWLFGTATTEPWGDSGAADFPFARIGTSAIQWGLAARWSLCPFDGSLIFLRRNQLGAVQVCVLAGTNAVPVSNPEVDHNLSTYDAVEDATGFSYMVSGHPFYQLNFPTADVSWLYDGLTKAWSRVQYGNAGRHRAEIQLNFLNRPLVTDYENGKVYLLDDQAFTDDGALIVREFVSRHVKKGEMTSLAQLWIETEPGVGLQSGQGTDPQLMLQISRDGGKTYGAELWRSIGMVGKYTARALWNRLGRARDWVFKVRITDPVKVVIIAAWGRYGR
jgi:hypothetical protein